MATKIYSEILQVEYEPEPAARVYSLVVQVEYEPVEPVVSGIELIQGDKDRLKVGRQGSAFIYASGQRRKK